jgi:hypothetical protein
MGSSDSDSGRRRNLGTVHAARLLGCMALVVVGLLLSTSSAFGFIQRGHSLSSQFAAPGTGEGQLTSPSGVAVNEATGDIYVVDRGNNRVVRFNSSGEFISTWGWGVKPGAADAKTFSVCVKGEGCEAGTPGSGNGAEKFNLGAGRMISPEAVAVDNSTTSPSKGDLYVVAALVPEKSYVYKFGPAGEYLGHLTTHAEAEVDGRPEGVAVDTSGKVWVDWSEGQVVDFTNGEPNKRVTKEEEFAVEGGSAPTRPGFAVDSHDNLFVNFEPEEKFEVAGEGKESEEGKAAGGGEECELAPCFVSKLTSVELPEAEPAALAPGDALLKGIDAGVIKSIAAEMTTDNVYVAQTTSVGAFTSDGVLIQRFGSGQLTKAAGVAVNAKTGIVYVTDSATGKVLLYGLEAASKPAVSSLSASKVSPTTATLNAIVDPDGSPTSVTFEYGTSTCTGGGSCTSVAVPGSIGEDFVDRSVSANLVGLSPTTTYHYKVIATNSHGVSGEEGTFTTQPTRGAFTLPDNRAWEMVSPTTKNGAGFESISLEGGLIQASASGDAITYIGTGPDESKPEGNRSPTFTQNLARRVSNNGSPEWSSKDIAIPNEHPQGVFAGHEQEFQLFSTDLSLSIVQPIGAKPNAEPPLSSPPTEKTIYTRQSAECGPEPTCRYVPIVNPVNDTAGTKFGGAEKPASGVRFVTASPDEHHVVVSTEVPLTNEPAAPTLPNFYEWTASTEQLQLVNVLPGAEGPASSGGIGDSQSFLVRHAISDDGSRIVFTAAGHLYSRNMLTKETVKIDESEAGVEHGPTEFPQFQTASRDGSRVFFTDEQNLTKGSTASLEREKPDLYVYDFAASPHLVDLTTEDAKRAEAGEHAVVRGLIAGANEDGSSVYFVANGVLNEAANAGGEEATPGSCTNKNGEPAPPTATCNLYVARFAGGKWATPALVAVLSEQDLPDWTNNNENLVKLTTRVSPSGQYLAFMSNRSLTGYDNRDVNPAANGARDEEVFLYDSNANSGTGGIVCPSCDPTGARPAGVLSQEDSGEGLGLLVDRPEVWEHHWIAANIPGWTSSEDENAHYQSRYLLDTGRLFFNASDGLVPADENGKMDVYQYEPAAQGGCTTEGGCVSLLSSGTSGRESAFLDASASGNDVFFLTAEPLVASDRDPNFDVYDAHTCSAESPCVTVTSVEVLTCTSAESCKPPAGGTPSFGAPSTTNAPSTGNVGSQAAVLDNKVTQVPIKKLTKAQQLARALKACKKLRKKKTRLSCERKAHKKYGAKKASKKKSHKAARKSSRRGGR